MTEPPASGDLPVPADGTTCPCGQGLWHPDSKQRGTCARCARNPQPHPETGSGAELS